MKLFHNFAEKILFAANTFLSAVQNFLGNKNVNPAEILVVKIDEIGDMVSATPVFRLLRNKFPDAKITLLCKPVCKTFMQYNPCVDEIICSADDWNKTFPLVIELRGTWRTWLKSLRYRPALRLDRGTVRFENKLVSGSLSDRQTNFLVVKPLLDETVELPLPEFFSAPQDKNFVEGFLAQKHINRFAVFHATANKPLKEWSQERFAQLADSLAEEYGLQIMFIGAKDEAERIEKVIGRMKQRAENLAGCFSLTQLFEFCKKASLYVGNDSGPMHIANVAGTPLVGLFGPAPAGVFYPFGEKAKVLHHVLPCNPCNQEKCVQPDDFCMDRIRVADVKAEIKNLM